MLHLCIKNDCSAIRLIILQSVDKEGVNGALFGFS